MVIESRVCCILRAIPDLFIVDQSVGSLNAFLFRNFPVADLGILAVILGGRLNSGSRIGIIEVARIGSSYCLEGIARAAICIMCPFIHTGGIKVINLLRDSPLLYRTVLTIVVCSRKRGLCDGDAGRIAVKRSNRPLWSTFHSLEIIVPAAADAAKLPRIIPIIWCCLAARSIVSGSVGSRAARCVRSICGACCIHTSRAVGIIRGQIGCFADQAARCCVGSSAYRHRAGGIRAADSQGAICLLAHKAAGCTAAGGEIYIVSSLYIRLCRVLVGRGFCCTASRRIVAGCFISVSARIAPGVAGSRCRSLVRSS